MQKKGISIPIIPLVIIAVIIGIFFSLISPASAQQEINLEGFDQVGQVYLIQGVPLSHDVDLKWVPQNEDDRCIEVNFTGEYCGFLSNTRRIIYEGSFTRIDNVEVYLFKIVRDAIDISMSDTVEEAGSSLFNAIRSPRQTLDNTVHSNDLRCRVNITPDGLASVFCWPV